MTALSSPAEQIEEQKQNNRSALAHRSWFAPHQKRLTDLICSRAAPGQTVRLCVLGAGNCFDLELSRLTQSFAEVHLVDIDRAIVTTQKKYNVEIARGLAAPAETAR